jgi:hypothetical protein
MARLARSCTCLLAMAAALAVCAPATGAAARAGGNPVGARAARTCSVPKYPGSGYFTSLRVKKVGCATGRKLALRWYECRTKGAGPKGRCHRHVLGFSCTEARQSIPTEFDARVTCRRKAQRIVHTYQQDT